MAGNIRNIIVGAAQIFVAADLVGAADITIQRQDLPSFTGLTAGQSASVALSGSASWRDVGFTDTGLSIAYTPTWDSVTVDQLKDAAMLFATDLTIELTTSLSEPTLQNFATAWSQPSTSVSTTGTPEASGSSDVLSVQGGSLGQYPVEHSMVAVGNAPRTPGGRRRERVYYARRVVSVSAVTTALSRTAATVLPVTFRMLPDPTYSGAEYGTIIDRTL